MIKGELITSMPIDTDTQVYIETKFTEMLGEEVRLTGRINESILGGFIAIIKGKVYDGSVLASMRTLGDFITDY